MSCADLFLALIAILFPPIAVWIKCGLCTADSFINIALCCLGYVPGLIHAWYIIARHPDQRDGYEPIHDSRDPERDGERVTYYYITHGRNAPKQYGSAGRGKPAGQTAPQQSGIVPSDGNAAGPSQAAASDTAPPPSYSDVVKGDNKVQTQD